MQTNDTETIRQLSYRTASAIRLLGVLKAEGAVQPLIDNIEFRDVINRTYPAVQALMLIGEDAVPDLLDVVKQGERGMRTALVVQVLMMIKGKKYEEFVTAQKSELSIDAWRNLLRYAIR